MGPGLHFLGGLKKHSGMINIHHLELFYYVARFEGIMEAVRNMPYGIQQPAVSGQILQLEADLGAKLFNRRPFELTRAGVELYDFIRPFFTNVEQIGEKLRGGVAQTIRMAAPNIALRDHLPEVLAQVRKKYPKLKLMLRAAHQPQVEAWLEHQEIDFAITILEGRPASGLNSEALLELPLVFLVAKESSLRSVDELLDGVASGTDTPSLITLPNNEMMPRLCRELLAKRGMEWPASIEVTSLDLIEVYVAGGFGVGLTLALPRWEPSPRVRVLPVTELPAVTLGAIWRGNLLPVTEELLRALRLRVAGLKGA
jgi:DNA-binding transcriptional LysR family regulator